MKNQLKQMLGFSLMEMLLVLVIVGMIIGMVATYLQQRTQATRIDRTAAQMQQILNAGLAYYVVNNKWPGKLGELQGTYLPADPTNSGKILSPWNATYTVVSNTTPSSTTPAALLFVYVPITYGTAGTAASVANIIAGKLPLSYVTSAAPTAGAPPANNGSCAIGSNSLTCYVVAAVNIPGQNLNNATAVNFAGIYHSGACVPVPTCPVDQNGLAMTPEIMVVPASVSGVNDKPADTPTCSFITGDTSGCQVSLYPISSVTASARPYKKVIGANGPARCNDVTGSGSASCHSTTSGTAIQDNQNYWRVCLSVTTEKGVVNPATWPNDAAWGQVQGTVLAITRCASPSENKGADFKVWQP